MKVGFIGLGHMGSGMAANLLRGGHELTVYNRSAEKRRPLLELGARAAATVADACTGEVVVTMLADDSALRRLALGDQGIVDNLRPGATHASMSTVSVELTRDLSPRRRHAGVRDKSLDEPQNLRLARSEVGHFRYYLFIHTVTVIISRSGRTARKIASAV